MCYIENFPPIAPLFLKMQRCLQNTEYSGGVYLRDSIMNRVGAFTSRGKREEVFSFACYCTSVYNTKNCIIARLMFSGDAFHCTIKSESNKRLGN